MPSITDRHAEAQRRWQQSASRRQLRTLQSLPGVHIRLAGRELINFSSNDYLGLAGDRAFQESIRQTAPAAFGSGAAHLLGGHHEMHTRLETALAQWLGVERTLLFSTGYMANLAVQQALAQSGDRLLHDRLNHASLLDGARLSAAEMKRFPHNDMAALERRLRQTDGQAIIVTESIFSMDGDRVPLETLMMLRQQYGAWLILDEAHAFGVLGEGGRGLFAATGLTADADVVRIGTLGKAFGVFGAFVAGSAAAIELILNQGRSYLFTTALPPVAAHAALLALRRVTDDEAARARLRQHITRFRQPLLDAGLPLGDSDTPIQPVILGDNSRTLRWQQALEAAGFLTGAVRPPTVPRGQARLRITLTAAHTPAMIDRLCDTLIRLWRSEAPERA